MEEVIARKWEMRSKACWYFIILGLILLIAGLIIFFVKDTVVQSLSLEDVESDMLVWSICLLIFGPISLIFGVINLIRFKKIPSALITLYGKTLTFADGTTCNLKDLAGATCQTVKSNGKGWGTIQVQLIDRTIQYNQVENVSQVQQRLIELMLLNREKEN